MGPLRGGAYWAVSVSLEVCLARGLWDCVSLVPSGTSIFGFPVMTLVVLLYDEFFDMMYFLPGHRYKSNSSNWSWTETFKTVSHNKIFLFIH
jgi:hypothetical protein